MEVDELIQQEKIWIYQLCITDGQGGIRDVENPVKFLGKQKWKAFYTEPEAFAEMDEITILYRDSMVHRDYDEEKGLMSAIVSLGQGHLCFGMVRCDRATLQLHLNAGRLIDLLDDVKRNPEKYDVDPDKAREHL